MKVVTFSDPLFSKKRIYVNGQAAQITHGIDHPVHGENFNISQKRGFFLWVHSHIESFHIVCIKLMWVSGWVYHTGIKIWYMKYQFLLNYNIILRKKIISFISLNKGKPENF